MSFFNFGSFKKSIINKVKKEKTLNGDKIGRKANIKVGKTNNKKKISSESKEKKE
ncbi:MAG: hypothetical protein ABII01_03645 [Candidatus Woesearchaeota archaeon]